ncbi:hypothetical protein B0T25DRAFT_607673 [Lasiosphaeria hispida]|uniref:Heterokaryon incompatibility domain-containing protein n=1 Tax=Lasiosphaeria hispida TaxID=260671 RepID=A0AAJ0HIJ9_9PEZI|nr:hypothetical protein B0T25DRAFT_607673 [Lasiosphaeria hispida]
MTCKMAAEAGISYAWVDTCFIDKSSSAELTEAINSMYRRYRNFSRGSGSGSRTNMEIAEGNFRVQQWAVIPIRGNAP